MLAAGGGLYGPPPALVAVYLGFLFSKNCLYLQSPIHETLFSANRLHRCHVNLASVLSSYGQPFFLFAILLISQATCLAFLTASCGNGFIEQVV